MRGALLLASLALLSSPARDAPRPGLSVAPFGGIDMSALDLELSAGCEEGTDGCEVVEPLVTVELRADLRDETSDDLRAPSAVSDAAVAAVSDAFFVWLTHPPESFWVNLAPTESDRVIEAGLGDTDAGKVLLEADLLLKRTAARLLHPDHELGGTFWDQLYGWVGTRDSKLCHSFRQWIVPGVAQLQVTEKAPERLPLLHVLRAPLRVRQIRDRPRYRWSCRCSAWAVRASAAHCSQQCLHARLVPSVSGHHQGSEAVDVLQVRVGRVLQQYEYGREVAVERSIHQRRDAVDGVQVDACAPLQQLPHDLRVAVACGGVQQG